MKTTIIAVINWVNQNSWIHLQLCSSSHTIYSIILQVLLPLSSKYIHNVIISYNPVISEILPVATLDLLVSPSVEVGPLLTK